MNKTIAVIVGLVLLLMLLLFSSTFTVKYNEVAIRARFGKADESSVVREAGLNMKIPIFDDVTSVDRRLQFVESPLEEVTTADGLQLVVRGYLLWRVAADDPTGPLDFFRKYETAAGAAQPIRGQFRTAFAGVIAEFTFDQLMGQGSRLAEAEERVREALAAELRPDGVEPVVVGVSQIMFPPRTGKAVVDRMKATRDLLANSERQKGAAAAGRIIAEANTNAEKINAFASQRAEEIKAQAQERAAEYLDQMSEDVELAIFLEWLDALQQSLSDYTTIVLPTSMEPFHLLDHRALGAGERIPMPSRGASAAPVAAAGAEEDPRDG